MCLKISLKFSVQVVGSKKSCGCPATLSVRVKYDTRDVRKGDKYAKKGLLGVIKINNHHSHALQNAEALCWLKQSQQTKTNFLVYFESGM